MTSQEMTVQRILFENGINVATFKENVVNQDGTTMLFRLKLSECQTEKDVIELMNQYV